MLKGVNKMRCPFTFGTICIIQYVLYNMCYITCIRNVNEILGSLIFFCMGISCVYNA